MLRLCSPRKCREFDCCVEDLLLEQCSLEISEQVLHGKGLQVESQARSLMGGESHRGRSGETEEAHEEDG